MTEIVSIITPAFNRVDLIPETADSIINQTFQNWEWIIIDDGSTDGTIEVVENYCKKDPRIKLLHRSREPKGAATCRNIGVQACQGKYLIFLDSDDLLAPFCIEQRFNAMKKYPETDFILFPALIFKEKKDDLNILWNIDKNVDDIIRFMTFDGIGGSPAAIWTKKSLLKINCWDESLRVWQDVDLFLRSLFSGLVYKKQMKCKPDVFIRINDNSLSRKDFYSLPKFKSRMVIFYKTLETIRDKNLKVYEPALKKMGMDLLLSGIKGSHYTETWKLIVQLRNNNLIGFSDGINLRSILLLRKLRLYKFPPIATYLNNKLKAFSPIHEDTFCKVKYKFDSN